jgi:phosphate-selective porin
LFVKGNLFEDTEFLLQGIYEYKDIATTTPTSLTSLGLLDAKLTFKLSDRHKLHAGQYVVPFSREDLASDLTIYTINRALVVDKLAPNRDIGVSLDGATDSQILKYSVGVFNGAGKNTNSDKGNDNDQFLYLGRMVVAPKTETVKVEIGANYARNNVEAGYARVDSSTFAGKEDLYGVDLSLDWNNSSFIGEYINAKLSPDAGGQATKKDGYYLQYAYSFNPKYQAVLKYEEYDADKSVEANTEKKWTTIGLNQYIRGNDLRMSYNYIFKGESGTSIKDNTFLTQLQVMF